MGIKQKLERFLEEIIYYNPENLETEYVKKKIEEIIGSDRSIYHKEYYKKNRERLLAKSNERYKNRKGEQV